MVVEIDSFFGVYLLNSVNPKVQGQDVHRVHGGSPEQDPAAQRGEEGRGEEDGEEETVEDGPGDSRVPI